MEKKNFSLTAVGDKLYLITSEELLEVYVFDAKTNEWSMNHSPQGRQPDRRWGHVATYFKLEGRDKLIVWAGIGEFDLSFRLKNGRYSRLIRKAPRNNLLSYDLETNTWDWIRVSGKQPQKRKNSAIIALDEKTLMITGGERLIHNKVVFKDVWTVSPLPKPPNWKTEIESAAARGKAKLLQQFPTSNTSTASTSSSTSNIPSNATQTS